MTQTATKKKPSTSSKPTRYEDDIYTWSQEQIALLKAGRLSGIDAANIAWELADVGSNIQDRLQSAIAVLAMHMLKWDHQTKRRTRSWEATVKEQRRRIEKLLEKNPGLKGILAECFADGYADARDRAVRETGLAYDTFPETCPYSYSELMTREIKFATKA